MKYWITWLKSKLRDWDVIKKRFDHSYSKFKKSKNNSKNKNHTGKKSERKKKQGW